MNFLSVMNGIDLESFGGMLSYDKETKQLTFTDSEGGKTYKCYVNSMPALVNFMRDIVPVMGIEVNNVNAAYLIATSIIGNYEKIIKKYIKLPITDSGMPFGSYVQWLKIAIDAVQIFDRLEHINGTWSALYSISGLTEGKDYGPKVESSFAGTINWGDGSIENIAANGTAQHRYTKDGNYTITLKGGTGLEIIRFTGGGGNISESALNISATDFDFKKTQTA